MKPDYSIVIPARNEEARLPSGLKRLRPFMEWDNTEIVFVDDGSVDATFDIATEILCDLPFVTLVRSRTHRGKGAAVREGMLRATGSFAAFVDADMATDPRLLNELFSSLRTCEVAIGSRSLRESTVHSHSARRVFLGRTLNAIVRTTTHIRVRDTQCGFKAFRTPLARLLFSLSRVDGFAFDIEILNLSSLLQLSVAELPVEWTDLPGGTVSLLREPIRIIKDMGRARSSWTSAQPIPAISISQRSDPVLLCDALGLDGAMILAQPRGSLLLAPSSSAEERSALASRARSACRDCEVTTSEVTVSSLIEHAGSLVSVLPDRFRS